jgi:hypothetical protein
MVIDVSHCFECNSLLEVGDNHSVCRKCLDFVLSSGGVVTLFR